MPIWSWIVDVVLWVISICLVGLSIRYIYKSVRILNRAKWSEYAEQYEGYLETVEKLKNDWKGMIEGYNKLIKDYETLGDTKKINETTTKLVELNKSLKEQYDHELDILKSLTRYAKKGGVAGFSTIQQIEATKYIAIAAAFLAISSVGFSVSSVIMSIVK